MEQNNLDRRDPQNDEDDYIDDTLPVPVKVLGWALAAFAFAIFAVTAVITSTTSLAADLCSPPPFPS